MKKKSGDFKAVGENPALAFFRGLYKTASTSDFSRKVAGTFGTRMFLQGVSMIIGVLIARILGPENRGLFAIAGTISAFGVQFGNLGLQTSNTYYVAKDRKTLPSIIGNSIGVSIFVGSLISLIIWITVFVKPSWITIHGPLLMIVLVSIPFGLAYTLLLNILIGIMDIAAYNIIELTVNLAGVAFLCLILILKLVSVEIVFLTTLASSMLGVFWAGWALRKYLDRLPDISLSLMQRTFGYGLRAYLTNLLAFLVLRSDILIVNHYLGIREAGLYSVAFGLATIVNILPETVSKITYPKLCSMTEWGQKYSFVLKVTIYMAFVTLVYFILAVCFAKIAIRVLFGIKFVDAIIPFIWLMPGAMIRSLSSMPQELLITDGFSRWLIAAWFTTCVISISLNLLLVPRLGMKGAAITSTISFSVLTMFAIWRISVESKKQKAKTAGVVNG